MRRADLLRRIASAARVAAIRWELSRQGAEHEVWSLDGLRVVLPRHREINERTAAKIMKNLEQKLGERWWLT